MMDAGIAWLMQLIVDFGRIEPAFCTLVLNTLALWPRVSESMPY
jgi:hypothetical protein